MTPAIVALHLGHMSALEQILVLVLGAGPFLLLAVVVALIRSRDLPDEPTPRRKVGA